MQHQLSAHKTLSRYIAFTGKEILEIGGSQSCESAYPFLSDGASRAVVTGLDHIYHEKVDSDHDLVVMRADALNLDSIFAPCSFDVVYGLSIVEHIVNPDRFLSQVHAVLKPGGVAYFEGNPIWSSPKGHHLWVATWGGAYQHKATSNYLFSEFQGEISTNPLPDWSHLLMTPDEMGTYLTELSLPLRDVDCILEWVFHNEELNRLDMSSIARGYSSSPLNVLEANTLRVEVPALTLEALRAKCGGGVDYGVYGVSYVLTKSLS